MQEEKRCLQQLLRSMLNPDFDLHLLLFRITLGASSASEWTPSAFAARLLPGPMWSYSQTDLL